MDYNFKTIEEKWQKQWQEDEAYKVSNESEKPKFYVLDMFPYPSGAGLHVGHPLGYIASDIYSRYKRLKGFNVLHPMGFDSFGLPAEQYAIETGQHPAVTTAQNIKTFKSQLDKIGFCYDWSRAVRTSDPNYHKWTQWIFLQLFHSWYNRSLNTAAGIAELIRIFEQDGNAAVGMRSSGILFTGNEWKGFSEKQRQEILMHYRLAYSSFGEVNWCEALGTVLANDEVVNGVSERGGHPVVKKKMRQWYLRITEYADRLLQGLEQIEFTESLKEQQRNWIGKSQGCEIVFNLTPGVSHWKGEGGDLTVAPLSSGRRGAGGEVKVYTTRPDTIFGVDFMVLAPEHELVAQITTPDQQEAINDYLSYVKSRSERERMAEVKQITGCFTGAYVINPFDGREIPVWIAEYVLAGYGTGAIMAVPCGDQRDFNFARHFNIPINNIIGYHFNGLEANPTKEAVLENSGFLNGMVMKDAMDVVTDKLEEMGMGRRQVNYRMRDAGFSRQRYWGEPFPIIWEDDVAYPLDENELPLELPHVDSYRPGPEGEGPLANITEWYLTPGPSPGRGEGRRETSTMPGYAGSSWYFLRYMDPHNKQEFCSRKASDYWGQVDLYIGGTEHAVGHLLYSRMWTKVLFDIGFIGHDEPYKRLVNQGMIQGSSRFVYRLLIEPNWFEFIKQKGIDEIAPILISKGIYDAIQEKKINPLEKINEVAEKTGYNKRFIEVFPEYKFTLTQLHVDVNLVDGYQLDVKKFSSSREEYLYAAYILEDGNIYAPNRHEYNNNLIYICGTEVEKMSKSKFNTVNPDQIVEQYGADTFRMYEMFLGPIEQSKPWDTKGIEGVHRFLRKLWRLFYDELKGKVWNTDAPSDAELKVLHRTIKKIEEDTEKFSFNTAVSAFMVCVNDLADLKCHKKEVLQSLLILLAPYAPHIAEELYQHLNAALQSTGENVKHESILDAAYPIFNPDYLIETSKEYPVSVNGKVRTNMNITLNATQEEVEKMVMTNDIIQRWLENRQPKKIIYVRNKMINVVV